MLINDWKWNQDTMGTGVVAIDREHQILVSLLNRMYQAIDDDEGMSVLFGVLEELLDYTDWHFSHEEDLQGKYDYPGAENHKKQHKALIDEVKKLQESIAAYQACIDHQMVDFLMRMLLNHIQGADFKFVAYLRVNNLI